MDVTSALLPTTSAHHPHHHFVFNVAQNETTLNRINHNCMRDAVLIAICNSVTRLAQDIQQIFCHHWNLGLCSIFCACVVFSILGYMAHSTGQLVDQVNIWHKPASIISFGKSKQSKQILMAVNQVVDGGEGLVFVVYPEVVSLMPEVCMKQRTISFKTPLQTYTILQSC